MGQLLLFQDFAPVFSTLPNTTNSNDKVAQVENAVEAATDYSSLAESWIPFETFKKVVLAALAGQLPLKTGRLKRLSMTEIRKAYPNARKAWNADQERRLVCMSRDGHSYYEIAVDLGRQPGAIAAKMNEIQRCKKRRPCAGLGSSGNCPSLSKSAST